MTAAARRAYGFARASVMKAGLRSATRIAGRTIPIAVDDLPDEAALFAELVAVYTTVHRGYPEMRPLVNALLARHELVNVFAVLRGILRPRRAPFDSHEWRPLGALEHVAERVARECGSPAELAALVARTRLACIAPTIREATSDTLGPAVLAAERSLWVAIDQPFADLPETEREARAIGRLFVLEQELDWVHRAPAAASIDPLAAVRGTVRLKTELSQTQQDLLAAWNAARGPIALVLPTRWTWARGVADWDALTTAIRRQRRRQCERAFIGWPFALAVPVALLLLKEEEVRAIRTAREAGDTRSPSAARAQAASLLGMQ